MVLRQCNFCLDGLCYEIQIFIVLIQLQAGDLEKWFLWLQIKYSFSLARQRFS